MSPFLARLTLSNLADLSQCCIFGQPQQQNESWVSSWLRTCHLRKARPFIALNHPECAKCRMVAKDVDGFGENFRCFLSPYRAGP